MNPIKIKKIIWSTDKTRLKIVYDQRNNQGGMDHYQIDSEEQPAPEMMTAIKSCHKLLGQWLGLDEDEYAVVATAVSFVWHDEYPDIFSARFSGVFNSVDSEVSVDVRTGQKWTDREEPEMAAGERIAFEKLIDAACRFINGDRAQMSLFDSSVTFQVNQDAPVTIKSSDLKRISDRLVAA